MVPAFCEAPGPPNRNQQMEINGNSLLHSSSRAPWGDVYNNLHLLRKMVARALSFPLANK
jgi:hypothetical protein